MCLVMSGAIFYENRKNLILEFVSYFKYVSTSQIDSEIFCLSSGKTKCRYVLKRLYDDSCLKRFREHEYIYYVGRKSPDWKSVFILNQLYFDIKDKGKIIKYQPELEFFSGRCDGFFVAEYRGDKRKFFVEVDRSTTTFKKSKIYNTLLQTDWESEWWADPLKRGVISFPLIVVLTMRRHIVERDFKDAKFVYHILDLYNPKWINIFKTIA